MKKLTQDEVRKLVNDGFRLDQEIKAKTEEVNRIKDQLKEHFGRQKVTAVGDGCQAKLGLGSKIVAQISDAKLLEKVRGIAGQHFETLFKSAPVQKFKDVAKAIFGGDDAKEYKQLVKELEGAEYQTCEFSVIK